MTMMASSESAADPLNPTLYSLLQRKFGDIKIANEGCSAHVQNYPDPFHPGRFITQADTWGEYYCVNCPFCKDTRQRLWVNHLYGSEYDKNRRLYTHLANCYNEGCLSKPGRREQLEDLVFGYGKPIMTRVPIKAGTAEYAHRATEPPGEVVPVDQLYDGHPARDYLVSRGFDPAELAKDFHIGLVTKAASDRLRITQNRLYIPILFNSRLVGWQARAVGDNANGPKYFNGPGTSKSKMLYNYDQAARQPYLVVVEGVPSVWRLGAAAVALFGKTMSLWQQTTIATTWAGKPVFVMLDADAQQEMTETVKALTKRAVQVVPVYLPDKRDPADYPREEIISLISMTGAAAGLTPF